MRFVLISCALSCGILMPACGKDSAPAGESSASAKESSASKTTAAATPLTSTSSSSSAEDSSAAGKDRPGPSKAATATTLAIGGGYDSKPAPLTSPSDAPRFEQPEDGLVGAGTLKLILPAGDGDVSGSGEGSLGPQIVSGVVEGKRLTATLRPSDSTAAYGTLDGDIEGEGDARVVKGIVRAASSDGKRVRQATFRLQKQP